MNCFQQKIKYELILIAIVITFNVSAQLVMPSIFSDNMILQRDAKIPVWGKTAPEAKVTVSFHGQKKVVAADKEGNWKVCTTNSVKDLTAVGYFFALELCKKLNVPIGLIQADFGGTIVETWMNSTDLQKWDVYKRTINMFAKYKNSKIFSHLKEKEKKEWFDKLKTIDPGFKDNWMSQDINNSDWKTIKLPAEWDTPYLKGHTGIVWYRKKINIPAEWNNKDIVVKPGLIRGYDITWLNGKLIGASLELHSSVRERLYNISGNEFKSGENTIVICNFNGNGNGGLRGPLSSMGIYRKAATSNSIQITREWLCKKGYEGKRLPDIPAFFLIGLNTLSVQYNSQIYPLIPYGIRGVIWYQGESNRGNSERYEDLFSTMIKSWRDEWEQGDFPFYYVQIAPYNYWKCNSAYLREAQFKTLKVTNTGMPASSFRTDN